MSTQLLKYTLFIYSLAPATFDLALVALKWFYPAFHPCPNLTEVSLVSSFKWVDSINLGIIILNLGLLDEFHDI